MAKYHINPTTGEPSICRARVRCPFGDLETGHYSSAEAARVAYEQMQKDEASAAGWSRSQLSLFDGENQAMGTPSEDKKNAAQVGKQVTTKAKRSPLSYEAYRDREMAALADHTSDFSKRRAQKLAARLEENDDLERLALARRLQLAREINHNVNDSNSNVKAAALFYGLSTNANPFDLARGEEASLMNELKRQATMMNTALRYEQGKRSLAQALPFLPGSPRGDTKGIEKIFADFGRRRLRRDLPSSHFANGQTVYLLNELSYGQNLKIIREALSLQDPDNFSVEKLNQELVQKIATHKGKRIERGDAVHNNRAVVEFRPALARWYDNNENAQQLGRITIDDSLEPQEVRGNVYGFASGSARIGELSDYMEARNAQGTEEETAKLQTSLAILTHFLEEKPTYSELQAQVFGWKDQPLEGKAVLELLKSVGSAS